MDPRLLDTLAHSQEYRKPPFWEEIRGRLFIYGTGTFAQEIRHILGARGIQVSGFVDHRGMDTRTKNGIPVFRPNDPSIPKTERKNSVVVLGIHNRQAGIPSIINNLGELGFGRIVPPIDLYDHLADELGERYWLTTRTAYQQHAMPIEAAYSLFADETSRETFASILRFRISGDYSLLPTPDMEHQYISPDLPPWHQPLRFVDCGAYGGDTLESFLQAGFEFQAITAFEPDRDNFRKLAAFVSQNRERLPNSSLFPCGVSLATTLMTFEAGKGEASAASPTGTAAIQCVALDECIPTFSPTLIKMDIEGAEMDALLGAKQLIKYYCPALAISVYHTPGHIWEIPLRVNEIARENNIRYSYHLRAHAQNCFDTIFYAIPERSVE